jgi:hypothetical protein
MSHRDNLTERTVLIVNRNNQSFSLVLIVVMDALGMHKHALNVVGLFKVLILLSDKGVGILVWLRF